MRLVTTELLVRDLNGPIYELATAVLWIAFVMATNRRERRDLAVANPAVVQFPISPFGHNADIVLFSTALRAMIARARGGECWR